MSQVPAIDVKRFLRRRPNHRQARRLDGESDCDYRIVDGVAKAVHETGLSSVGQSGYDQTTRVFAREETAEELGDG